MKQKSSATTLRDIAIKADVSITTVSRILNDRATGIPIRDTTRQRVLDAAKELGYKPNLLARGLHGSRSSLLGVIARDIADPFHTLVLRGIHATATQRGYRLFLGHVNYKPDDAVAYGSMFELSHADGIILIGDLEGDEEALAILAQQHRHMVGVTDRVARRLIPGVYADSVKGTRLALEHLWGLGHRRTVCISDPRIYDEQQRIEVYQDFMRERDSREWIRVYTTDQDSEPSFHLSMDLFAASADGSRLATASGDGTAKVWDAATGKELVTISVPTDLVVGVAFSPDGSRLGTASFDPVAHVWDAETGKRVLELAGHQDWLNGITFSPDGARIATSIKIQYGRLFLARTGRASQRRDSKALLKYGTPLRVRYY